jgi:hypothetical protein
LDANLPPEFASSTSNTWVGELREEIHRFVASQNFVWRFWLTIVTNHPDHYGVFGGIPPMGWNYFVESEMAEKQDLDRRNLIANELTCALQQYGNIPEFDHY